MKKVTVGISLNHNDDIKEVLGNIRAAGFDYICTTVVDPALNVKRLTEKVDFPFSWTDLNLPSADWNYSVVAKISQLDDVLENGSNKAKLAEKAILEEINFCQHLTVPAILFELTIGNAVNLARTLHERLAHGSHSAVQFSNTLYWIKVKMASEDPSSVRGSSENSTLLRTNPWRSWDLFRSICNYERRLFVVLELTADIPDEEEIKRWLGEPVKVVFIDHTVFISNTKGYPVLSKAHQAVLKKFFRIGSQVLIHFNSPFEEKHKYYKQYIEYLHTTWLEDYMNKNSTFQFSMGYEDFLQSPLQPLMDNLESHTYEIFEKDPIKYQLYQDAIYKALLDKIPEEKKDVVTLVLMVLGAGRGPLVYSSIRAAKAADRKIRIYAVEKNVNTINTLRFHRDKEWNVENPKLVTLVSADMRKWDAPEKADIIVSELLGSFGDNELSPECLDGAQKFLNDGGIMIPENYTSFLSPVMSSKLYNETRSYRDANKHYLAHFETPYVVDMRNRYEITESLPVFTFEHPNVNINKEKSNERYKVLNFKPKLDCTLHGFAGYFESKLYGDVYMSINPATKSEGMCSWFPMFFPIKEPIHVKKHELIETRFWRLSSASSVWYEWCITSPTSVSIHNTNGRSYTIGLN